MRMKNSSISRISAFKGVAVIWTGFRVFRLLSPARKIICTLMPLLFWLYFKLSVFRAKPLTASPRKYNINKLISEEAFQRRLRFWAIRVLCSILWRIKNWSDFNCKTNISSWIKSTFPEMTYYIISWRAEKTRKKNRCEIVYQLLNVKAR